MGKKERTRGAGGKVERRRGPPRGKRRRDSSRSRPGAATDVAGWTPLHTAAFVGRPGVVSILLGCGADSRLRSLAGQCAADLCSDARTRGRLVVAAPPQPPAARPRSVGGLGAARLGAEAVPCIIDVEGSGTPWQETANPEKTQAEVRYEPFFVPRSPVIDCQDQLPNFNRLLTSIGQVIFDKQPGRGLAFLVATGALRDYPVDMIGFLRSGILHPASIGEFLGEDFSLSRVLRMEFFNLMRLRGCGVVASLAKVFLHFQVPEDLQKADRLLQSIAEVWWRQHTAAKKLAAAWSRASPEVAPSKPADDGGEGQAEGHPEVQAELAGAELRAALPDCGVLHQLLFSAFMLHRSLGDPLCGPPPPGLSEWIELHRGVAGMDCRSPDRVLTPVYRAVQGLPRPGGPRLPPAAEGGLFRSPLAPHARAEGWAKVVGGDLPWPLRPEAAGYCAAGGSAQLLSLLSETAGAADLWRSGGPPGAGAAGQQPLQPLVAGSQQPSAESARAAEAPGPLWLSLCRSLLFLSWRPDEGAPFAFVHAAWARVEADDQALRLVLRAGGGAGASAPRATPCAVPGAAPGPRGTKSDSSSEYFGAVGSVFNCLRLGG
ncbi:unnamed protein product, partial [Prorocentrum cordatum]